MSDYTLRVIWKNAAGCEIAMVRACDGPEAAHHLHSMILDGGGSLEAGDSFEVREIATEGPTCVGCDETERYCDCAQFDSERK